MSYLLEAAGFPREAIRNKYRGNRQEAMDVVQGAAKDGEFRLGEGTDLGDLFEAITGLSWTTENVLSRCREAVDPIMLADFRLATSQLIWRAVDERMLQATFIGDQLYSPRPTTVLGVPEKVLYFSTPIKSNSVPKREAEENTYLNTVNGYYEVDPPVEYREAIALTERIFLADRSGGRAIDYAFDQLNGLKIAQEYRRIGYALGTSYENRATVWNWALESKNTPNAWPVYNSTAGGPTTTIPPYINTLTGADANPLTNYNSINQILVRWSKFRDPMSNTLVQIPQNLTMVVPYALDMTADIIRTASMVQLVDNQPNANTLRFTAPNPLNGRRIMFTVLTSQYVSELTGNDSTWFLGNFKAAFERNYAYEWREMEMVGNMPMFERNIQVAKRVDYMENYNTRYPLMVFKNVAT